MKDARQVVLTVAGVLATAGVVIGVLMLVNADAGLAGCTITSPFGWMAPLLAGSVIGGAAWALMGQRRAGDATHADYDAVACDDCGREVLGQWRMCPYCGSMLDRRSHQNTAPEHLGDR